MGTNSKSSHASYAIAPSDTAEAVETSGAGAPPDEQQLSDELVTAKTDLMVAMDNLETIAAGGEEGAAGYPDLPEDPAERYEIFAEQIKDAKEAIETMKAEGASEEEIQAQLDALRAQSLEYLNSLSPEELQQIAAAKGFEHPALVGLSGKGQHPLVHWLDPYYDDAIPSKQKIQAKALQRYDQLLAGQPLGGMTLAELHELEGTPLSSTGPAGTWSATFEQIEAAQEAWKKAADEVAYSKGILDSEKLQDLLQAEKQILTAHCPDIDNLEEIQAKCKIWTGDPLEHAKISTSTVLPLVQDAIAAGDMSLADAQHLKPREIVDLLRTGTAEAEKEALKAKSQARQDQLAALDKALDVHSAAKPDLESPLALPDLAGNPEAAAQVAEWATSTGELHKLQTDAQGWIHGVLQPASDISMGNPGLLTSHTVAPKALTTEFNAWAKEQKLGDLRDVAEQMGMPDADKAARAHVTSFIASSFNPALDKEEINAKVAAAAAKKKAGTPVGGDNGLASDEAVKALQSKLITSGSAPSSAPASSAPSSAPSQAGGLTKEAKEAAALSMGASPEQAKKLAEAPTPAPAAGSVPRAPVKPAPPGSFNAKVQALVANLQQVKATTQDVPARIDADVVGSWSFGPGKAANLGGTYAKSLHDAPDGSSWLFKADKDGGAIAHAESAASHALSLGGLPSVPVYVKNVEGKSGSVQPMLKDTHHFAAEPKNWSQSEVDAIVRSHVGAWLVGDHDGHQANVLRTASGGLVRCDLGQAFKHYGQDQLALGYAPSGGGSYDPVHQKLYQAALSGGLGDGIKVNPAVAHPIIKNFEAIPDSQWRSMLHSTAHEGVKAGVHWVPTMRKAAAKQHGIPSAKVSSEQIAEAFLDHAVQRKQSLRESFTNFFVKELNMPTAASLKHGAK
ncbi:hypothetical protein [Streptomyces spongiae]|uniref:Uncharacterized protein n=1 Tax=Streptomyces spongiae TaxID=565072 RepID=A0A5N8XCK5_9ACTN|nr:hypothetical protein [Streptomyces spongiae]MPY57189.1 hypothetical protein [Streptomyces spongiae]